MQHPCELLTEEETSLIRGASLASEKARRLSTEVLELIYHKQWLRIMLPRTIGGLEWELPEIVCLFEALAWADGNVGWCVNLGAGANMFSGYLRREAAAEIFHSGKAWCAGSGAISGKAVKAKNGYFVSGKWKYASGASHATHFTANCYLVDEKGNSIMDNARQAYRSFIFPASAVNVIDTWKVTGLKATSSNDFEVRNLFVPETHTFDLLRPSDFADGPLFRFPFDLLAIINMAVMPCGMALHFIDLFDKLISTKKPLHHTGLLKANQKLQSVFKKVTADFYQARSEMYDTLTRLWSAHKANLKIDPELHHQTTYAAKAIADQSRNLVHTLYPFCGMDMIYADSELNKVWRDLSVAGQHYLLRPF